ncbi:MAG: hypothetical protein M1377_04590 [Deltaproteobacteria bacterium]|nr:hypothetical protein [Deltaproteobacteria bacterium]
MSRSTNRSRAIGPEIWFRIVHAAVHGQNGAPLATYREQEVEVALGPLGIIEDGHVGTLTRRLEANQVVSVDPLTQSVLKRPMGPKTPRVAELLRRPSRGGGSLTPARFETGPRLLDGKGLHGLA